jgi:hypothetical protein
MTKAQAILLWNELATVSAAKYAKFIGMNIVALSEGDFPGGMEKCNRNDVAELLREMADALDRDES